MENKETISNIQYSLLLLPLVTATGILYVPSVTTAVAGRDAWLSPLFSGLLGIVVVWIIYKLSTRFPEQSIVEYCPKIFGKWIGNVFAAYLVLYFASVSATVLREFSDFVNTVGLRLTPPLALIICMVTLSVYVTWQGIEVLLRTTIWIVLFTLFIYIVIVILSIPVIDLKQIRPFFENGFKPVLKAALIPAPWFGELMTISFLIPRLNQPQKTSSVSVYMVIFITIIMMLTNFTTIGVFGPLVSRMTFPLYELARFLSVGDFLERLDPFILAVWLMAVFLKFSFFHYITVQGIAQLFQIKDYHILIIPTAIIIVVLSFRLYANSADLISFLSITYPIYGTLMQLIIPAIMLVSSYVLKRKGDRNHE